ncbi:MAG: hypothetical protein HY321_22565 [Armatimonadetes bacterium]|nr:hypothetical protein [Armatimonadota bacterium]
MDDERWETLIDLIDDRFGIEKTEKTKTTREDGSPEWRESNTFVRNGTRFKIERVTRPKVLDVKTFYARRHGGSRTEAVYSETERSHTVRLYQWQNGWEEVDLSQISR